MILYQWRGSSSNFGDELNTVLWPRLLPGFFDDDPAIRFLGIGSILDCRHPRHALKLVAGAGYGGYEARPVLDDTWVVHWVRGPRTAAVLGLPGSLGLGDPAMLLPHALNLPATRDGGIGFMPHFESLARGAWQKVAALVGVTLIDPRLPPLEVLAAIGRCRLVLSEAMHGIIVADALRVPWIAIRPLARIHRAKWQDWAETAQVTPRFATLPASSVAERVAASSLNAGRMARA
jgi:succinoglycan biosynthesis protein ExoV